MLGPAPHIRYHIAAILAAHWVQFVAQYKRWIRPVVFENVRKVFVGCFFGNWNQLQQLFVKAGKDATIAAALLRPG
jgi:hypothetical protein